MRQTVVIWTILLGAMVASGCKDDNPNSPSTGSAPYSATDIRLGSGTEATVGKRMVVNYTGWLYSAIAAGNKGTQFDTSVGRGPYTFTLGVGQVIRGWDQGVAGMKVGGLRRLVIPPELAYGSQANGPIPANATLLFEVELLDVQG